MQLCILLLTGFLIAGGPPAPSAGGASRSNTTSGWELDSLAGRKLESRASDPRETSLGSGAGLYEGLPGSSRLIAERVGHAAYAPDGVVLYVQDETLVAFSGEERKVLARGVAPDFALEADGRLLAIVRPAERAGGSAIDLLPRAGGPARRLVEPIGLNGTPVFTPDGKTLVFSSTRTGTASFFRVELDGSGIRQLTNVGLRVGTGAVFGPRFVPPAENRHELRFVGPRTLEYRGAGGLWRLDVDSGKARLPGDRR